MFKERLLSTLILIPLFLWALFYGSLSFLTGLIFVLVGLCAYEWQKLMPLHVRWHKGLYLILVLALTGCIHLLYTSWLLLGLAAWCVIIGMVLVFPRAVTCWGKPWIVGLLGAMLLPLFSQSLISILEFEGGRNLLLYLMGLVWSADVGAYVFGKQFGKTRLIPKVSPGKTWEGLAGGMLATLISAGVGYYFFEPHAPISWAVITLLVFEWALFGDLFISMLKRRCDLKDTGHLIPGHGGILDRLDSLIAAAPIFYLGIHVVFTGSWLWLIR